jgi:hypothetical protein
MIDDAINTALEKTSGFDGFINAMIVAGCEVKQGANLSFKIPGATRFARCKSLGADYTEEAIRERIEGVRIVALSGGNTPKEVTTKAPAKTTSTATTTTPTHFNFLINIQEKLKQGKGAGYAHWARSFNLQEASKTLIFLQEIGVESYDDLIEKSSTVSADFNQRLTRIKEIESRQKEITELQKNIGVYGKTRETYKLYLASNRDPSFYETHRADITLHEAAKRHFDQAGYGKDKKLPAINTLKQEWAALEAEKKNLYRGYRELKDRRMKLLMAKDNVQRLLGISKDEQEHPNTHKQKHNHSHEL